MFVIKLTFVDVPDNVPDDVPTPKAHKRYRYVSSWSDIKRTPAHGYERLAVTTLPKLEQAMRFGGKDAAHACVAACFSRWSFGDDLVGAEIIDVH